MSVKPAYTSSIVQVKAGQVIPAELLKKLCSENKTAFGYAVREPGGIVVDKFQKVDLPKDLFAEISNIMEGRKKFTTMFCFHAFPDEYDDDEVQPFTIRDQKGNPILAIGIEGDFPQYIDTSADKFSEAFMLMQNWLGPKIEDMHKLVGGSHQKLFDYLRSVQFQKDFANVIGHRGILSFLPSVGESFMIDKNELGLSSTWGDASNVYGYTEAVQEAGTKVEEPAPQPAPVQPRKSKYATEPNGSVQPSPAPAVQQPAPQVQKPAATPAVIETEEEMKPPSNIHGKKLKGWYRQTAGVLPADWEQRPTVKVKVKRSMQQPETETAIGAALKAAQPKDMKAAAPKPVGETMPIISGEMQKSAIEMIKKYLGDGSGVIDDPLKANEEEQKLATFVQLMAGAGVKSIDDLQKWRASFIFAMTKQHPETMALAIIEQRNIIRDLRLNGEKPMKELTGTQTTKTGTGTQPATSEPAPSPQPEPEQKVAAISGVRKSRYS